MKSNEIVWWARDIVIIVALCYYINEKFEETNVKVDLLIKHNIMAGYPPR